MDRRPRSALYRQVGDVQIVRRDVDVAEHGPDFRSLAQITVAELQRLDREIEDQDWHFYVNPQWTVTAQVHVLERDFLRQAEWACIEWMKAINRTIGPAARKRRVKAADHAERRLIFGGVLVLNGRPAHAKRLNWRANRRVKAPR